MLVTSCRSPKMFIPQLVDEYFWSNRRRTTPKNIKKFSSYLSVFWLHAHYEYLLIYVHQRSLSSSGGIYPRTPTTTTIATTSFALSGRPQSAQIEINFCSGVASSSHSHVHATFECIPARIADRDHLHAGRTNVSGQKPTKTRVLVHKT